MSPAMLFLVYGSVVVLSSTLVLAGLAGLLRVRGVSARSSRLVMGIGVVWVLAHLGVAVSPIDVPGLLSSLLVLGSSLVCAALLARTAGTQGALVALAVTASIVDVVSFSGGVTAWLLTSESEGVARALRFLTVTLQTEAGLVAVVGIGDLAFLGAFYLGLVRHGGRPGIVGSSLVGALLIALAVGLLRGGAFGIPFMAVAVVALSLRWRRKPVAQPCEG